MKYKIATVIGSVLLALSIQAQQVTVNINSGNPRFPFPQFLDYSWGDSHRLDNLGTQNPEGVVHAEMEQDIRDAYQIFANEWQYTGDVVGGVKYIRGNIGCPYDCREGDGYSLLAAALMGDKTSFDGLWMCVHDKARVKQPRYIDGVVFEPDYAYGDYALKDNQNSATDGDVDIALALYVAWMQWGDDMGVRDSRGNMISYRKEMIDVIRGLVAMSTRFQGENPQRCNTGEVGFDGYMKNGDTWTEITNWASQPANYLVEDGISKYPEYGGPQEMHTDYLATGYFREFYDLLQKLNLDYSPIWEREQYRRAEASGDWFVGNWVGQSPTNIFLGEVATISGTTVTMMPGNQGGRFRSPWRTALNYVWHGNPIYSWNPTTHKVVDGGNTYELNAAKQFCGYMNSPQDWGAGCACTKYGGGPAVTYKGPSTLQWDINPDGTSVKSAFTLNWVPACGTPSAVAAQDLELLGQLYRQCNIEWDVKTGGDGYLTSVPVYFHGWFRLLGMLIATGNHQAPSKMVPQANMKIYRVVQDSVSCAYTGDVLTYHLDYRNYGSVDAQNVKIVEHVPDDFIYVENSATNGGVYDAATHTVTWNLGTVPGFKTGSLDVTKGRVSYDVKIGPKASGRYCTTAEITCSNGLGWTSNEYPNAITPTMQRNCVDVIKRSLIIEKTADREQTNPGTVVTYTIKFENSSEAGWLDGGRPRVGVAVSNAVKNGGSQMWLRFRLYNDAIEPYINYGNYRIAYYMYDASMKQLASGGRAGWNWYTAVYEGKRSESDKISVSHETVVEDSDEYGKWNQRLLLQFAPLLVTSTGHISNYYGMGARVHRGGAEPLRVFGYINPSDWSATNFEDDWSYSTKIYEDEDDGLYFPVTPSWQEIDPTTGKSIEKPVNTYNPSICETPKATIGNILVEEFDGYTWRRILGTGPMAGRDAENVVIRDTLPKGLTFVAFQGSCPLAGSGATWRNYKIADGRDVVEWKIPMLQIKQKGNIVYQATATFPSGKTCQTADEDIDNLAWIYADLNSPIADTATVTVTCAKVPEPVKPTTLKKVADVETVSVGDEVTYTIEYEQTHGATFNNAGSNASDWTTSAASVSGGTVSLQSNQTATAKYNNSYSENIYVEFDCSLQKDDNTYIYLRDNIELSLRPEYATMKITCKENGTLKKEESISSGGASTFHIAIKVTDGILQLWSEFESTSVDTSVSPAFTAEGLTKRAGYLIFKNTTYGNPKYSNIHVHTDYAYNLKIVDEMPNDLQFVSASNGGTLSSGKVVWTKEQGLNNPIPFGKKYTETVTAKVVACSEKIVNEAHVELLGHADDEIRAQAVIECGASAPAKPMVASPVTYCQGDVADPLSAVATGTLRWYTTSTGGTAETSITPSTTDVGTTTYYVSQFENGQESARAEIDVIVNAKPSQPIVTASTPVCVGDEISLSAPLMAEATYAWTGPNGFSSTDRQVTVASSAETTHAGVYSVVVTSGNGCESEAGSKTVVVNARPVPPTVTTPLQYCKGETVTDEVSATGTDLKWYTTETDPTEFTSLVPATTTVGEVFYFVSQTIDGCESERAELVVRTLEPPTTPVISTNSPVCVGDELTLETESVGLYSWTGPNGFSSTERNPSISAATAIAGGEYSLVVKEGNCSSEAGTATVVVNANPNTPTVSNNGPKCEGETLKLTTPAVADALYKWTAPNGYVSTEQNPEIANVTSADALQYSLQISVNGCKSAVATTTPVVHNVPAVPTVTTPVQYCKGETVTEEVSATGENLQWYTTSTGSTKWTSLIPVTATVGDASYFVSQIVDGCESERAELVVKTLEPPTMPTITTNSPVCADAELTLGTESVGSYSWTGPNGFTSEEQNPTISTVTANAAGEYSLVVKVGNCLSEARTATVVVNPNPTITIDEVASLCIDASSVTLKATATPTGGIGSFSGAGVTGSTISPATAGVGSHTITYTYSVNGCEKSESITIKVQDKPEVSFALPATACESGETIALTGNHTDGTFSAVPSLDLSTGFNPSLATVGQEYGITYTYSDGVCSNSVTHPITVYDPEKPVGTDVSKVYTKVTAGNVPALVATGVNQVWYNDASLTTQVGTGISYTPAESVVLDGGVGKVGSYTYYVVSTDGGCVSEKTAVTLDISACEAEAPILVNNVVKVCKGETDIAKKTLSVTAGAGNVRWYLNGVMEQDDVSTSFMPTQTDAGSYTFYVSLYDTDANCESGKSSITYIINELPNVSFDVPAEMCVGTAVNFAPYQSQASGVVRNDSDEVVTSFNPTTSGSFAFAYSYTDDNTCTNSVEKTIVVNPLPTITITPVPDKCDYDAAFALAGFATPAGGTFSGDGVSAGQFNPTAVAAGSTSAITYTYTDGKSCTNTDTFNINVIARPTLTFNKIPAVCVNSGEFDLEQYVTPKSGTFSGEHISGTGFNPEVVGKFLITYKVTDKGCSDSETKTITVNKLPDLTLVSNAVECVNTGDVQPTVSPAGGTLKIDDSQVTAIQTAVLATGNYTLKYEYTDPTTNCSNEITTPLEIREIAKPTVADKSIVVSSTDLTITATGNGGTLVWEDENGTKTTSASIAHPSSAVAGSWQYCVTETDGTCESEPACMTFTVIDCPTPAPIITPIEKTICASDEIPSFEVSASGTANWYKNAVLVGHETSFRPTELKGKPGTYTWTVSQTDGCEGASTTVTLAINPNPVVSITNTKTDFCDYDDAVTITATADIAGGTFSYLGDAVSGNSFAPANAAVNEPIAITVSYEAPNGCSAESSKNFTVHHVNALSVTTPITQLESDYETVLSVTPDGTNKVTWYDACETKRLLARGVSFSTGLVGEASEDYGVTQTDAFGCESECSSIQVNRIKCPTPAPTVTIATNEICATEEVPTFVASGIGSTFSWYKNGALISNGTEFTPTDIQGKAGSYNWIVTQTTTGKTGCEGVAAPIMLKINPSPEIMVTIDDVICQNEGIKTPISNFPGTTFIFDGMPITSIDPRQYTTGTFELQYSYNDPVTGCPAVDPTSNCFEDGCLKKSVEIRQIPSVKVSNITKLITSDDFSLSIVSGNGGAYTWTDDTDALVGIGATIDHAFAVEVGSWNYCVTETDGTCTSDPSCMVFSIINCPVPAPTVINSDVDGCTNEDIPALEAQGEHTLRWYKGTDMNTIIAQGTSYIPNDIVSAGDYTYYVTQYDGVCEGLPTSVTLHMRTTAQPKITGNAVVCENEPLTLSADGIALWYSDETLNTLEETTQNHTVSYALAGTYTLHVTHKDSYCESNPVPVSVKVNAIPDQPVVSVSDGCEGDDIIFSATGTNVQWKRGAMVMEEGDTYIEQNTIPGVVSISATQTVDGCESSAVEVSAIVYGIPHKPQAVDVTICDYKEIEPVGVIVQSDEAFTQWYDDEGLQHLVASGVTEYLPSEKESRTFYVTQTLNECVSEAAKVSFKVNSKPADVRFKQSTDVIACEGNQVVLIAESSNKVFWYDSPEGRAIFTGRYFTLPTSEVGEYTYYATQTDAAGCISDKTPKKVTIQAGPTAANLVKGDTLCIYDEPGRLIVSRNSENETVSWISPTGATLAVGDTLDVPAGVITKAGTYYFKARTTVASCSFDTRKETRVPYVVYPKPESPNLEKEAFCHDGQPVVLSTKAENPMWYSDDNQVMAAYTQEYRTTNSEIGSYSVRLSQMQNGCVSDTVRRSYLISAIPSPTITGKSGLCTGANETYVVTKNEDSNSISWDITGNRGSYELSSYTSGFVRAVDWIAPGFDTINVKETNKYGCVGVASLPVEVTPAPDAQFMTETLGQEGVVTFSNLSECQIIMDKGVEKEFHVDYFWDFGRNTDTALVLENRKTFEQIYKYGDHTAELVAVNEYGCSASTQETFFVDMEHGLFVPTAFAPSQPAHEVRLFKPKGFNCRTFEIWIYDHWNNLVYYSSGVNDHGSPLAEWDGTVNGKLMQAGTYRYKIEVTFEDHSEENLKITQSVKPIWGSVELIR